MNYLKIILLSTVLILFENSPGFSEEEIPPAKTVGHNPIRISKPFPFEHIAKGTILDKTIIHCMVQDEKGFMWFGTNDGLYRYDGLKLKGYKSDPYNINSISGNVINCITLDDSHNIWIGTYHFGLNKINLLTDSITRYVPSLNDSVGLQSEDVNSIYYDHNRIYLSGDKSFEVYDISKNKWVHVTEEFINYKGGFISSSGPRIISDRNGRKWKGGKINLLSYFDDTTNQLVPAQRLLNEFIYKDAALDSFLDKRTNYFTNRLEIVQNGHKGTTRILLPSLKDLKNVPKNSPIPNTYSLISGDNKSSSIKNNVTINNIYNDSVLIYQIYFKDKNEGFWAVNKYGIVIFDPVLQTVRYLYKENEYPPIFPYDISSIDQDKNGQVWIGTFSKGVFTFDPLRNIFICHAKSKKADGSYPPPLTISNGHIDNYSFEGSGNNIDSDLSILELYCDRVGNTWLASNSGVYLYNPSKSQFSFIERMLDELDHIGTNSINLIYEDNDSNIWVGTRNDAYEFNIYSGAYKDYYRNVKDDSSLSSPGVSSIFRDRNGNLWVGTFDGLNKLIQGTNKFSTYRTKDGLLSSRITVITEDLDGNLIIGTGEGLNIYNEKFNLWEKVFIDSGLSDTSFSKGFRVTDIQFDKRGNYFVGTNHGLIYYNIVIRKSKVFKHFEKDINSLLGDVINNIKILSNGMIVVNSKYDYFLGIGFDIISPGLDTVFHFTENSGLLNNYVRNVFEDDKGLWVVAKNEFSRISPKEDLLNADGNLNIVNYGYEDGLQMAKFQPSFSSDYPNAGIKTKDGRILIGGEEGIISFYPDSVINDNQFPVVLTDLFLFNKVVKPYDGSKILSNSISYTKEIVLHHDQNVFSLAFVILNYSLSYKNRYSYKLEGFESNWNFTSWDKATASYTNLNPGVYYFHLKGANSDGVWSEQGVKLKIIVLPPWWKTWWAYLVYFLMTILTVVSITRYRTRQLVVREKELERIVADRTLEVVFQKDVIEKEKQKSDDLLLNILPAEIMEELKATGKTQARNYDLVTVLFADFKDFTQIIEELAPEELVAAIDSYFEMFDQIIAKYPIEKIKTVGDAYICVSGLPQTSSNNPLIMMEGAIEMIEAIEQLKAKRIKSKQVVFDVRIGIHSGPLVAGVVGIKKFAYDIWGDTVNTAARMQQYGEPGKINISGTTYGLVKHRYSCIYRGKIEVKHKGDIDMYFVISKK